MFLIIETGMQFLKQNRVKNGTGIAKTEPDAGVIMILNPQTAGSTENFTTGLQ